MQLGQVKEAKKVFLAVTGEKFEGFSFSWDEEVGSSLEEAAKTAREEVGRVNANELVREGRELLAQVRALDEHTRRAVFAMRDAARKDLAIAPHCTVAWLTMGRDAARKGLAIAPHCTVLQVLLVEALLELKERQAALDFLFKLVTMLRPCEPITGVARNWGAGSYQAAKRAALGVGLGRLYAKALRYCNKPEEARELLLLICNLPSDDTDQCVLDLKSSRAQRRTRVLEIVHSERGSTQKRKSTTVRA
jgi:hypothetical protein